MAEFSLEGEGSDFPFPMRWFNDVEFLKDKPGELGKISYAGSLATLVGTKTSIGGISYDCHVRGHMTFPNLYVPIGSFGLSQAMLSCLNWGPARFLVGAGEMGSTLQLCGLKASGDSQYVGLQSSNVELPVRSIVGESLVLELVRLVKTYPLKSYDGVARRITCVAIARIENDDVKGITLDHPPSFRREGLSIMAFLMCVWMLFYMGLNECWTGLGLVIIGMLSNAFLSLFLRLLKFNIPKVRIADGSPPGDAVVQFMDDPDVLCILQGPEEAIQSVLQKPIFLDEESFYQGFLFWASTSLYIYSIFVWLVIPFMTTKVQFAWAAMICFGAVVDLSKGCYDRKRAIAKNIMSVLATKKSVGGDVENGSIEKGWGVKFSSRTAAIAYIINSPVGKSEKMDYMLAIMKAKLLPTMGHVWENWWKIMADVINERDQFEKNVYKVFGTMFGGPKMDIKEEEKKDAQYILLLTLTKDLILGVFMNKNLHEFTKAKEWNNRSNFKQYFEAKELEASKLKARELEA